MEEDRVLVHVLQEILLCGQPIFVELDPVVFAIEVQHGVERVVIQRYVRALLGLIFKIVSKIFSVPV